MMKNKKIMVVFILIVAFLLVMVTGVKANDDVGQLPTISTGNNPSTNDQVANNNQANNQNTAPIINNTNNTNNSNDTLPQTGVAGDTVLFIFITVCIASAGYAYFRIKKYNDLH